MALDKHLKNLEEKYSVLTKQRESQDEQPAERSTIVMITGFQEQNVEDLEAHREIQNFVLLLKSRRIQD